MDAAFRYLKWNDDVVGLVAPDLSVRFAEPRFNTTVGLYTHGQTSWTPDQFLQFLSERIMSPARRDIERLLFRCGLSEYDVFKIADATRAINPRDELWLAPTPDASMAEAATEVFDAIFLQRTDAAGDSVDTPEGANVKRYGASQGAYGIVKQRISPLSTDVESEVAASLLAEMLGMPCCRAWRFGDDAVFSAFEYDFTCEYLVHMRRLFDGPRGENELENLLAVRPQYADDLYCMIAFDFITRQDEMCIRDRCKRAPPFCARPPVGRPKMCAATMSTCAPSHGRSPGACSLFSSVWRFSWPWPVGPRRQRPLCLLYTSRCV